MLYGLTLYVNIQPTCGRFNFCTAQSDLHCAHAHLEKPKSCAVAAVAVANQPYSQSAVSQLLPVFASLLGSIKGVTDQPAQPKLLLLLVYVFVCSHRLIRCRLIQYLRFQINATSVCGRSKVACHMWRLYIVCTIHISINVYLDMYISIYKSAVVGTKAVRMF